MLYFIFTTPVCNLNCRYCGGTIPEEVMPHEITYDFEDLKRFIEKDRMADIAFYGGEPLLRMDFMERVMNEIKARHYFLQTNGIFLNMIKPEMLKRFHTILISIDGPEEITDYYRGGGVYRAAVKNAKLIRKRGFEGDLIARMTVSQESGIYRDVMHLLSLQFDHVHWQLNVVWDPEGSWKDFRGWLRDSYYPGLKKLSNYWIESIEKTGKIPGIVPFQGVMKRLMGLEKPGLPCGAGRDAFAIDTMGRILACPIAGEFEWNILGNIRDNKPEDVRNSIFPDEPCQSCPYYSVCGGRCLFANKERLWGEDGFNLICETVKYLIDLMVEIKPRVEKAIENGTVREEMLMYPEVNNTTEIIP